MPMLDIQRRHATVFRIRFGERNGNRPVKLTDAIRVTSPNPDVVDAFIAVYGGERREWEGQWEAKLPTTSLRIVLLPGQSVSQWWELYKGSVCERRCDSVTEMKSGKACVCPTRDAAERTAARGECNPTTRVNVICPDVDVIGSGAFICHGLIGAETLPQAIAVAETLLARGLMVPAVLRVQEFRGRNHFIVPQIEVVGMSTDTMRALAAADEAGEHTGLDHVTRGPAIGPAFTPIRQLPEGPRPSVQEQVDAHNSAPDAKRRKNAAEPIRPTGMAPRTAAQAGQVAVIDVDPDDESDGPEIPVAPPRTGSGAGEGGGAGAASPAPAPHPIPTKAVNKVAIAAREAGLDDDGRHDLAAYVSDGRVRSSAALTDEEAARAIAVARRIRDGEVHLARQGEENEVVVLLDNTFGFAAPTGDTDPSAVGDDSAAPLTTEQARALKGPLLTDALRTAGLELGGTEQVRQQRLIDHIQSIPF